MYEKKLQKGTDDLAKKAAYMRDLEVELARVKEESRTAAQKSNGLQENLRFLFVIGSDEDILERLTRVS